MNAGLLGALAALSWGTHDFVARFPSRAVGPVNTVLAVTGAGFVFLSVWLLVSGEAIPLVLPSLLLVALSGIAYALGTLSLYAALAAGPIAIVTPIAGSYPALAVMFALTQGVRPSLIQWAAIVAVMAGVVVVSRSGSHYERSGDIAAGRLGTVLLLSAGASVGFAIGLTAGQVAVPIFGDVQTTWYARIFGFVAVGVLWLLRPKVSVPPRWVPVLGLMGALDVAAMLLIVAAGSLPDPAIATVASSAFGAVAIVLARIFLKERMTLPQVVGIIAIFIGVAVLAGSSAAAS